jgi:uncharacterized protein
MDFNTEIFIDSSFFKAILDPQDDFHDKAEIIWDLILKERKICITSNFILDETITLLRSKCNKEIAFRLRDFIGEYPNLIKIKRVLAVDEGSAWEWFEKDWSKLSFTDCVSFAQMKRLGITQVATFDDHFTKAGFKVVGEKYGSR